MLLHLLAPFQLPPQLPLLPIVGLADGHPAQAIPRRAPAQSARGVRVPVFMLLGRSDHCFTRRCCCGHALWHHLCIACPHWHPSAPRFLCSFYHAFNANGFRQQLLQHIEEAVGGFNPEAGLRIHLTGAAELLLVCCRLPSCICCAPARSGWSARPRRLCVGKFKKAARGCVARLRHRSSRIT